MPLMEDPLELYTPEGLRAMHLDQGKKHVFCSRRRYEDEKAEGMDGSWGCRCCTGEGSV